MTNSSTESPIERLERKLATLQDQVNNIAAVAVRVDQTVHAHQPFIDKLAHAQGDAPRTVDGRTLMVLAHWAQVLLTQMASGMGLVALSEKSEGELRAAIANVKYVMEHVSVEAKNG